MKTYYIYILSSFSRTLYVGVTNNLERRVWEHKSHANPGFASRYNIDRLVYFEGTSSVEAAIAREKQIKRWLRSKKIILIETHNPGWRDLSGEILRFAQDDSLQETAKQ